MGLQLVASFVYTSDSSSVLSAARTAFFRFGQSAECVTLSEMENTIVKMSLFLRSWKGGEAEGRSHNFHRHFLIPETLQKTNCVK